LARKCGPCNACCTIMDVPAVNSPEFQTCGFLSTQGGGWKRCTIYAERPPVCQEFKCAWLAGMGRSKDRPNQSKIFAHYSPNSVREGKDHGPTLVLTELRPGQLQRESRTHARYLKDAKASRLNVVYRRMHLSQIDEPRPGDTPQIDEPGGTDDNT